MQIALNLHVKTQLTMTMLVIFSTRKILSGAVCWVVRQRVEVILYGGFGTTVWSHLHGSIIQEEGPRLQKDSSTLKMGAKVCTETSVRNYHHTLRNNAGGRNSDLMCGGSLK